jgi:L-alanine-DL-glutamate epimerase-like enolase superfamily enzyme
MNLRYYPHTLELRHAFTIATASRTTTPAMIVEVEHEGVIGYGEASMPPYLGESQATAAAFLDRVDLTRVADPFQLEEILPAIDALAPGNTAAKAAVDIALHDWIGKKLGAPWHRIWGLDPARAPVTSFTIGIDTPEIVRAKTHEAAPYKIIKVKLGRDAATDRQLIETIREVSDRPITVDANQGWRDRAEALRMIEWLAPRGVVFIEQAVQCGSAGVHLFSQRGFGQMLGLHFLRNLPGNHALDGHCCRFLQHRLLGKKVVEIRSNVFFVHDELRRKS